MTNAPLLVNYMHSRHCPAEENEIKAKKEQHAIELKKKCMYTFGKSKPVLFIIKPIGNI